MTVTVIGTGFVGVVSSAVYASFGNTVYGLDIDAKKIEMLKHAEIPFYEPQLKELVAAGVQSGKLHFTTDYAEAIPQSDVILIAVGTPSASDGQADLKFVFAAVDSLAPHLKDGAIVAVKSTVPPGTNAKLQERIKVKTAVTFSVASLPEFLKEGTAVQDTLHPDRVVIGATDATVIDRLQELHKPFDAPFAIMRPESAQMCKYASNAYLATRITFINQIANLCEQNGADISEVIEGIGYDKRIGKHYWYPGLGYGGSCFPKDVKELAAYSKAIGQDGNLMVKVNELNEERIPMLMDRYGEKVGGWKGKTVAVLGLSFKPNTDDMREAPSVKVVPYLVEHGAKIRAFDPMAIPTAKAWFPNWTVDYVDSAQKALTAADVIMVLVEWPELISLDLDTVAATAAKGAWFIDVRNQYVNKRTEITEHGLQYIGVGVA
jgi:UDPglucose 6-dehydrogenase